MVQSRQRSEPTLWKVRQMPSPELRETADLFGNLFAMLHQASSGSLATGAIADATGDGSPAEKSHQLAQYLAVNTPLTIGAAAPIARIARRFPYGKAISMSACSRGV